MANKNGNNEPLDYLNPKPGGSENWEFEIDGVADGCEINVSASDFDEIRCTVVDDITQPPTGGAALYLDQNDFEVEVLMTYLDLNSALFFGMCYNFGTTTDVGLMGRARSLTNGRFQALLRQSNNLARSPDGNASPAAGSVNLLDTSGFREIEIGDIQHSLRMRFNRTNYRMHYWWNDTPVQVLEETTLLHPFAPAGIGQNSGGPASNGLIRFDNLKIGEKGSQQNINKMFWGGVYRELTANAPAISNSRRTLLVNATPLNPTMDAVSCPILEGAMYWEIVIDVEAADGDVEVGIAEIGSSLNAQMSGSANIGGFTKNPGTAVPQYTGFGSGDTDNGALPGWVAGDVVQLRYDAATRILETQTNDTGGWVAHTNLAPVNQFYAPFVTLRASCGVTANFGLTDLSFSVPGGFNALSDLFATP